MAPVKILSKHTILLDVFQAKLSMKNIFICIKRHNIDRCKVQNIIFLIFLFGGGARGDDNGGQVGYYKFKLNRSLVNLLSFSLLKMGHVIQFFKT
jgi:hypothetical protein